ncbi:hypothetical protein PR048_014935 [Dryococelus australis]|uniref:Uncharacterized protein n=1 Tax=Dryococelus australis TaxID=614101 RepID=A0ABQ9HFJ8_9NEOP|nr:hypothetical protein PR048_014935 [Dryococelus australis]
MNGGLPLSSSATRTSPQRCRLPLKGIAGARDDDGADNNGSDYTVASPCSHLPNAFLRPGRSHPPSDVILYCVSHSPVVEVCLQSHTVYVPGEQSHDEKRQKLVILGKTYSVSVPTLSRITSARGHGWVAARALTSHQDELDYIPGGFTLRISCTGIMPNDDASWRVFSGISLFRFPCIPTLLNTELASPSLSLKTSLVATRQLLFMACSNTTQGSKLVFILDNRSTGRLIPIIVKAGYLFDFKHWAKNWATGGLVARLGLPQRNRDTVDHGQLQFNIRAARNSCHVVEIRRITAKRATATRDEHACNLDSVCPITATCYSKSCRVTAETLHALRVGAMKRYKCVLVSHKGSKQQAVVGNVSVINSNKTRVRGEKKGGGPRSNWHREETVEGSQVWARARCRNCSNSFIHMQYNRSYCRPCGLFVYIPPRETALELSISQHGRLFPPVIKYSRPPQMPEHGDTHDRAHTGYDLAFLAEGPAEARSQHQRMCRAVFAFHSGVIRRHATLSASLATKVVATQYTGEGRFLLMWAYPISDWLREALGTSLVSNWLLHAAKCPCWLSCWPATTTAGCDRTEEHVMMVLTRLSLIGITFSSATFLFAQSSFSMRVQRTVVHIRSEYKRSRFRNPIVAKEMCEFFSHLAIASSTTSPVPVRWLLLLLGVECQCKLRSSMSQYSNIEGAAVILHVGIMEGNATGRQVFSEISRFPSLFIPALLRIHLASPSSALKTSMFRVAQTSSLTHSNIEQLLCQWLYNKQLGYNLRSEYSLYVGQETARRPPCHSPHHTPFFTLPVGHSSTVLLSPHTMSSRSGCTAHTTSECNQPLVDNTTTCLTDNTTLQHARRETAELKQKRSAPNRRLSDAGFTMPRRDRSDSPTRLTPTIFATKTSSVFTIPRLFPSNKCCVDFGNS